MSDIIKEVNGTIVTNTDIEPPANWTNDFEEIGGDMMWGEYGDVAQLVQGYALDGTVQPLFGMKSYTGEALSLFELSGNHYLYNAIEGSIYQIRQPEDLETIVSVIGDENQGLSGLDIEAL